MTEEKHAFQITVSALKDVEPYQESYHKYYLERVEPPDEKHLPQEIEFIQLQRWLFVMISALEIN